MAPFPGLPRWASTRKVKPICIFTEARDSEWQRHQLGLMQVCTLLQTDNHTSTPPLCFFTGRMPFLLPNSIKALKAHYLHFTQPQKKTNTNCCTAALALYLLLFSASYYLHSPRTASGARYRRCACIDMDMLRLWGSGLLRHGLNFSTVWCTVQLISVEDWKHTLMQKVFRVTTFCIKTCFHSFLTLIGQRRN